MSVHESMLEILRELPAIGKDQTNEQQRFHFRGHDDILNALNPLLSKHGVYVIPDVIERVTAQRTTSKGSVMFEVNLHVRFRFYGAAGDYVEASTWGEGTDMGDKATNKAMTMAFKNVLNQAFAISSAEFKDADGETPEETKGRANEVRNRQSSEGDERSQNVPATTSPSEGFQAPKPATEKPVDKGVLDEIGGVLLRLNEAFPEHPGQGRTWADVAREHSQDRFQKSDSKKLTLAEGHELRAWLEDEYQQAAREAQIPFETTA